MVFDQERIEELAGAAFKSKSASPCVDSYHSVSSSASEQFRYLRLSRLNSNLMRDCAGGRPMTSGTGNQAR